MKFTKTVALASWKASIPVMLGYLVMGFAGGVLLAKETGLGAFWAFFTSATAVSGTLQFLLVDMLKKHTALFTIAILTLSINIRYALYGLPLIDRWRHIPLLLKLYMILTLTDETFALEVADNHPDGEDSITYCFFIAMFDHLYWIVGVIAGNVAGHLISFNSNGIDFAMTALFMVILLDQLKTKANRIPALIGLCSAIVGLLVYPANMLIPSIVVGLIALLALRSRLENSINIGEGDTSHA
ncbi:MAG: AzlC family ABC transporter permease [Victivallales bacterium]|nr:AzlC family ABC transporter permease [Victivallales bacterium]